MTSTSAPVSVLQLRSSAGLYGAERMLLALNPALCELGVHSHLLSINNYRMQEQALDKAARALGQPSRILPCDGRLDLGTVRSLGAQLDASGPVLLHAHDYKSAFYAWSATRGRNVPLLATLHGQVRNTGALRLYSRVELALLRRFDVLAVVSSEQISTLTRAGIPRARLHQVDNGIDLSAHPSAPPVLREDLGLPRNGYVFAAVARLSPEKNLASLLDAFHPIAHENPDASLLIIGDGPDRAALQDQARRLGLDQRVRFTGVRDDMPGIYPLVDCLVLPSLSEGMPMVILEAMSFAIPVIATTVGDIPRLLSHSAHGQLVHAGDTDALEVALRAAMEHPGRRDERARDYVLEHHSARAMAERYIAIYQPLWTKAHARKAS